MNLQKIFEYALQREKEGYKFFKSNADSATHAAAAQVFQPFVAALDFADFDIEIRQRK